MIRSFSPPTQRKKLMIPQDPLQSCLCLHSGRHEENNPDVLCVREDATSDCCLEILYTRQLMDVVRDLSSIPKKISASDLSSVTKANSATPHLKNWKPSEARWACRSNATCTSNRNPCRSASESTTRTGWTLARTERLRPFVV